MEKHIAEVAGLSGIPTKYRGVVFRSRLEAKWAAFFDLLDIPWNYEPYDLPGWIPDFSIGCEGLLVEVKPFTNTHQWNEEVQTIHRAVRNENWYDEFDQSGHTEFLLLGESPRFYVEDSTWGQGFVIGWLYDGEFRELVNGWCGKCDHGDTTIISVQGRWFNRLNRRRDKLSKGKMDLPLGPRIEVIRELWGDAQKVTQWKKRRSRNG